MSNGPHADGLSLQVSQRWFEFLDFYVAKRIPEVPDLVRAFAPSVLADTFGAETPVPEDRFTDFDRLRGGPRRLRGGTAHPGPLRGRHRW